MPHIAPFTIDVSPDVLEDLAWRLRRALLIDAAPRLCSVSRDRDGVDMRPQR